jgi:hypothetical protein
VQAPYRAIILNCDSQHSGLPIPSR